MRKISGLAAGIFLFASPCSALILSPQDAPFSATCDGVADDTAKVQAWATAYRDMGVASASTTDFCGITAPILFQPSTNIAPVVGPSIIGNLKLKALPGFTANTYGSHGLQVFNPDAVTSSQNFYYPRFDSFEFKNASGLPVSALALRGFWGSFKRTISTTAQDTVVFPYYCMMVGVFGCIPDVYESMPNLGDITGLNNTGIVYRNLIGLGASPTIHNLRGSEVSLSLNRGLFNGAGSEKVTGTMAYSGADWAFVIDKPPLPAIQAIPHEQYSQGPGDVDCAQYGWYVATLEVAHHSGHRMNWEPPGICGTGTPSWPIIAYYFGAGGATIRNVTFDIYITIRNQVGYPNMTVADLTNKMRFGNNPNIQNLTLNITLSDQTGLWAGMPFASKYQGIHGSAKINIIENGIVLH